MAYLTRRPSGAVQIRESIRTSAGPRSRTLAAFAGTLDEGVINEAERRATRPIDRTDLIKRARAMGIAWQSSASRAARHLVHGLRHGEGIEPAVKRLLLSELGAPGPAGEAPFDGNEFEEVAEWVGASPDERASSLRGLLRLGDAIVQSRGSVRVLPQTSFPVFSSGPARHSSLGPESNLRVGDEPASGADGERGSG